MPDPEGEPIRPQEANQQLSMAPTSPPHQQPPKEDALPLETSQEQCPLRDAYNGVKHDSHLIKQHHTMHVTVTVRPSALQSRFSMPSTLLHAIQPYFLFGVFCV
jgi:hypothetical protein